MRKDFGGRPTQGINETRRAQIYKEDSRRTTRRRTRTERPRQQDDEDLLLKAPMLLLNHSRRPDVFAAEGLLEGAEGCVLGDRIYHSPNLCERLGDKGLCLLTPCRVQGERKGTLATSVEAKEAKDRDGYLSGSRALPDQEGVSPGSLAPNLALCVQGVEPNGGRLLLLATPDVTASRSFLPIELTHGVS